MSSESPSVIFTGRVKWFNNKTGYGFLTVIQDSSVEPGSEESKVGLDVFVHHSALKVEKEQYRYLVQGEYVQFQLSDEVNDKYKYQALNISGIAGGQLLCETRYDQKNDRLNKQTLESSGKRSKKSASAASEEV
jgi:cold shock CspA family protein